MGRTSEPAATTGSSRTADACAVTVLLLETGAEGARRIEDALADAGAGDFRVEWVSRLADALERLKAGDIDIVLVGLNPPDHDPMDAFDRIRAATPDALVLPLNAVDLAGGAAGSGDGGDSRTPARQAEAHWLPHALRYVTQRKKAEAELRAADEVLYEEKERARVTLSSIGDAVLVTDREGRITYMNPMAEAMTGWECGQAMGRALAEVFEILDGDTREPAASPAERAMRMDRTVGLVANCVLRRRDGSESGIEDSAAPIHDRHGQVSGAVIVFRDINQSRAISRKMAYLAQHDALTGLPNRVLLDERLGQAMRLAQRHGNKAGLLFVDLDDFKQINDSLGHIVGDYVLQAVGNLLTACVRTTDTVCRLGGDEFVILLAEIDRQEDASRVAEKILATFASPLSLDGHELRVTMSIGGSVYPDHGDHVEALVRHADAAMYRARGRGHNNYDSRSGRDDGPHAADREKTEPGTRVAVGLRRR